jgi:hypothetical protein
MLLFFDNLRSEWGVLATTLWRNVIRQIVMGQEFAEGVRCMRSKKL